MNLRSLYWFLPSIGVSDTGVRTISIMHVISLTCMGTNAYPRMNGSQRGRTIVMDTAGNRLNASTINSNRLIHQKSTVKMTPDRSPVAGYRLHLLSRQTTQRRETFAFGAVFKRASPNNILALNG